MATRDKKLIILSGGGTAGSVSPLLSVVSGLKEEGDYDYLWLGTFDGPEKQMAEASGIKYRAIPSGKLRRYFSLANFTDIFQIIYAFFVSCGLLKKLRPSLVISAGSFVSVPVVWAAWCKRVPVVIHQQDVRPGLANKLMAPFANAVTTALEISLEDYKRKGVWIGNPVRPEIRIKYSPEELNVAYEKFGLYHDLPVILVVGGGTGSLAINMLLVGALPQLGKHCQVLHVTGKGKEVDTPLKWVDQEHIDNYKTFEFLDATSMAIALNIATVVVSRSGMGLLSELSHLAKASILIPMPDSHQEDNAAIFAGREAAVVLAQVDLEAEELGRQILMLLNDKDKRIALEKNIKPMIKTDVNEAMLKIINSLIA